MSTYEILPYMFEPESDVENVSGQDEQPDQQTSAKLQDTGGQMVQSVGPSRSTGIQVNLPETCPATTEKPSQQHIVDEEAIVQLMQSCPMCNRKCRCRKRTCGSYVVFYQGCYFCDYQRKWASQPEASNTNTHDTHTTQEETAKGQDVCQRQGSVITG